MVNITNVFVQNDQNVLLFYQNLIYIQTIFGRIVYLFVAYKHN